MAQVTDRNIGANPTGFDMRTEINNIIAALESDNSGSSAPLNTVAYMKWLDTSNSTYYYYKERNHDNTAWVTLFRYTVATKIMEVVSNGVVLQDSNLVHKTGDETIAGIKTFSSSPIVPIPTTSTQSANKSYVDALPLSGMIQGIKVGNTAIADAITLDWYEEGTFTPTIVGATTAGVGTYTYQIGKYTRIGNAVNIMIQIVWTAHTGTGKMILGVLPFSATTTQGFVIGGYDLTITGQLYLELSATHNLYSLNNGTSSPLIMDTSGAIVCNFTYFV